MQDMLQQVATKLDVILPGADSVLHPLSGRGLKNGLKKMAIHTGMDKK